MGRQIDSMLENYIIQPSASSWASGIVLIWKKDGTKRFCIDYRCLNDVTVKGSYSLPSLRHKIVLISGSELGVLAGRSGAWRQTENSYHYQLGIV